VYASVSAARSHRGWNEQVSLSSTAPASYAARVATARASMMAVPSDGESATFT
jgi:hypothetical protein